MLKFSHFLQESQWMYHGTTENGIESLKPQRDSYMLDRAIGSHFAADPLVSQKFASGLYKSTENNISGTIFKTKAPKRSELEVVYQKTYKHGAKQSDQSAIAAHVASTVLGHPDNKEMFKTWIKHTRKIDDDTADEIHGLLSKGKAPSNEKFGTARAKNANSFRTYINNFDSNISDAPTPTFKQEIISKFHDIMAKKGKKGLVYLNTSPMETSGIRSRKSYIIFHPENLPLERHES